MSTLRPIFAAVHAGALRPIADPTRPAYGPPISSATLDRLLAVLLVIQVASGLLTLRAGVPATAPLFWLHGLVGGALLVAATEKLRRSVGPAIRRRRWGRLALGALLTLLVAAALAGGFTWVASGRILSIGPWTILTLHVWAALAVIPVVLVHLVPRRFRLLRPPPRAPRISRRTLLGMGALAMLGAVAWGAANVLDRVQGGARRFTGSRWLPAGGIPPPTTLLRRRGAGHRSHAVAPGGDGSSGAPPEPRPTGPCGAGRGAGRRHPRLHLRLGDDHVLARHTAGIGAEGRRGRRTRAVRGRSQRDRLERCAEP